MNLVNFYSPAERQSEKQQSRDRDDSNLRAGRVSVQELAEFNGFYSSLNVSSARINRRGRVSA